MDYINNEGLNRKEEELLEAAKAGSTPNASDMMKALMEKYRNGEGRIYEVITTVQTDDETEEQFTFLFHRPRPASYDRYIKTMSTSVTKASRSFVFDNIVEEQKAPLQETMEEYPAMSISLAEKLLRMLGLADATSVKKL